MMAKTDQSPTIASRKMTIIEITFKIEFQPLFLRTISEASPRNSGHITLVYEKLWINCGMVSGRVP